MDKYINMNSSVKKIKDKEIAIIGIDVRMPDAQNIKSFWDNLALGKDSVKPFPRDRAKDIEGYFKAKGESIDTLNFMEGAYIDDIDKFDYHFFRLSPKEACYMNPNQKIFLESVYKAIEDAGYGGKKIIGSNTGVYAGYIGDYDGSAYKQIIAETKEPNTSIAVTGNLSSIITGRISYIFDLKGPSMLIDTACSSSLVAVHTAVKALQSGECEMAIVGSVKTNLIPLLSKEKVGIESSNGKTRAFDDASDGTGIGEGVAVVILKPLNKALRDRDSIYAVIKGSAINQDGNSIGLTAPNLKAQSDVIIKAWKDAGINPEDISYIEAHGTGTKIGDPIEIEGIQKAFRRFTQKKQFCAIGSLKSNIGHLYDAAGIAGLIKVVLSLKYRKIPPTINFSYPNRKINFEDSPVYVNNILSDWHPNGEKLLAGISSFGFSGTNCHLIVQESPEVMYCNEKISDQPYILTLSAKSEKALERLIKEYNQYLLTNTEIDSLNLCYTSNTGRDHHNYRIAILFKDTGDLKLSINEIMQKGLQSLHEEGKYYYGFFINKKNIEQDAKQVLLIQQHEYAEKIKLLFDEFILTGSNKAEIIKALAQLYISGADIDWQKLYNNTNCSIISLPTYQFERERCWVSYFERTDLNYKIRELNELFTKIGLGKEQIEKLNRLIENKKQGEKQTNIFIEGRIDRNYTETEVLISNIWGNELGYNRIDIYSSFYELGGDSILASKIVNSINNRMNLHLNISDLLKLKTVSQLAAFIDENTSSNQTRQSHLRVMPAAPKEYYPITSAQQRMFISTQLKNNSVIYNMPYSIEINGSIEEEKVISAFKELVKRHEAFRSSFHLINGVPMQKIHENVEFNIPVLELDYDTYLLHKVDFIKPFDMGVPPLLRMELIKVSPQLYFILLDMQHIISDGSSLGIMLNDLDTLFSGNNLPELPIQYKDFAEWQLSTFTDDYIAVHKAYWLNMFKDKIPELNLPTDFPRPKQQSFEGDEIYYVLDNLQTEKIKTFIKAKDTTLFVFLMSAYNILLYKYSGQPDIVVGTPVDGRPNYESGRIIGMFVNMLALRTYIDKDLGFCNFMNEVKEKSYKAFEHQDYQFDHLVDSLNLSRFINRGLLFDTVFAMYNMRIPNIKIDGRDCKYHGENKLAKYDITVQAFEANNEILFSIDYCTALFKKETIFKMFDNFINVINTVISNPDITIKDIEIGDKMQVIESVIDNDIDFNF